MGEAWSRVRDWVYWLWASLRAMPKACSSEVSQGSHRCIAKKRACYAASFSCSAGL